MATRAEPAARAERAGILARYTPAGGGDPVETPERTRWRLLASLERGGSAAPPARPRPGRRPPRCPSPRERLGRARGFGIWLNLYSLRGGRGLGVGSLSDLAEVVRLAGAAGADFVGLSPLHALRNRGDAVSPYQPRSRLFRNPLYLDVEAVPEWRDTPAARRLLETGAGARERAALEASPRIAYERAARLQRRVLEALHASFRARQAGPGARRRRDYERFVRAGGPLLRDFATFCVLEEREAAAGRECDWRRWPAELRAPGSPALARFRARHAEAVELELFAQFELDRQLAAVAAGARRAGLAIGLQGDLALGSAPSGFDGWAFPEVFVEDVSLGAPPDAYAREGQDWGIPPAHPWRLADGADGFWRRLLRANLAHAGALRVDHALGLLRQFWIPRGERPARGGYVRYPSAALLGALAEEARRAGAVVVGEDLGTVPRGLASLLARFGVLSSRVVLFERDGERFRPARRYSRRALASVDTHDLPPLAGWWSGRDLALRAEIGDWPARRRAAAQRERDRDKRALLRRLERDGLLRGAGGRGSAPPVAAVHRFLCRTPCPLVSLSLDDLAGEREPVNLPGIGPDRFPSWTRRMRRTLADLARDTELERALAEAAGR